MAPGSDRPYRGSIEPCHFHRLNFPDGFAHPSREMAVGVISARSLLEEFTPGSASRSEPLTAAGAVIASLPVCGIILCSPWLSPSAKGTGQTHRFGIASANLPHGIRQADRADAAERVNSR